MMHVNNEMNPPKQRIINLFQHQGECDLLIYIKHDFEQPQTWIWFPSFVNFPNRGANLERDTMRSFRK